MLVHWPSLLIGGVDGDSRPAKVSLQETSRMEVDLHDKFVVAKRVHAQSWDAVRGCKPKVNDRGSVPAVSHNFFEDAEGILASISNRRSPCLSGIGVVAASGELWSSSFPVSCNGRSLNVVASWSETSLSACVKQAEFLRPPYIGGRGKLGSP